MATVKLILRKSKVRSDGTAPIYLRITANRKSRFLSSGVNVEPKHWNDRRQEVRRSHELAAAYNAKLHDLRVEAIQLSLEADTAQQVKRQLDGSGGSLTAYILRYIEGLDQDKRYWGWKRTRVHLGKLQACFGQHIDWKEIDRDALVQFERYLAKEQGNAPSTIRKEMAILGRVFRQAVKDGELRADQNPFHLYDLPRAKPPERIKLTLQEIDQLASVTLEPGSWAALARDAWLISFYLGGMRFGDLASLKVENLKEGRCTYRMNKTERLVSLPIPEQAQSLLQLYLEGKEEDEFALPFLKRGDDADPRKLRRRIGSKNALCNRFIKVAAKRAGLDKANNLSMHISRHSFADYARQKSGNLYAISKTLGHASLQITQAYLKSFDQEAVDQLADELWS